VAAVGGDDTSAVRSRIASLVGVFLSFGLLCCGGSAATPASSPTAGSSSCVRSPATPPPSSPSTQGNWQVILTVKTAGGGRDLGITGVTLDGQGNLYLAEFDDDLIYKYSSSGSLLAQWGGHGSGPGQLEGPDKLAFDSLGNVYVTEVGSQSAEGNSRIQKFSPIGTPLAQWGTFGSAPGQFSTPVGIAIDQQGDIYVADVGNHRIQKLSSQGKPLTQWHTVGSGTGESTEIGYDLALDACGNVYVSDAHPFSSGNDRIQKFSPSGNLLAAWGGTGTGPGKFGNPTGIAVDSKGNVFVVDSGNNRIQELSSTGQYLAEWKGPDSGFQFTSKVAVDGHGNMYVSDGSKVLKLVIG
jgi:tripartite motif-containing protein 71